MFVEVNTTTGVFKSKSLIGADGVNSVCARCVRPRFKSSDTAFSLASEMLVSGEYIDEYFSDMVEFHFDKIKKGYAWIFLKDKYLPVGIGGINAVKSSKPLTSYYDFITGLGCDYVKPRGHFLSIGGIERKPAATVSC